MFCTIHRPSASLTCRTLSLAPSPMSTQGRSSAPMWTAVGISEVSDMPATLSRTRSMLPAAPTERRAPPMIDIFDPDVYVAGPPHDLFTELRRTDPVH